MDNPLNTNYGLINIDSGPLCGVANNLIDKLSSAIGWIANRPTPDRIAQKIYIESIEKSDYPPLVKAAMISKTNETIKEYGNQCNIVKNAIENLNPEAEPDLVENDWLAQFMNKSKLVSNEQFQLIWGKILADECNSPNSIPKGLLHILEQMDNKDAEGFSKVCSLSPYICDQKNKLFMPVISAHYLGRYFNSVGLTFDMLSNLESLGLIQMDMSSLTTYTMTASFIPIKIHYFDEEFEFPDSIRTFSHGNVRFTKAGQALCQVISTKKQPDFFQKYCVPVLKESLNNS